MHQALPIVFHCIAFLLLITSPHAEENSRNSVGSPSPSPEEEILQCDNRHPERKTGSLKDKHIPPLSLTEDVSALRDNKPVVVNVESSDTTAFQDSTVTSNIKHEISNIDQGDVPPAADIKVADAVVLKQDLSTSSSSSNVEGHHLSNLEVQADEKDDPNPTNTEQSADIISNREVEATSSELEAGFQVEGITLEKTTTSVENESKTDHLPTTDIKSEHVTDEAVESDDQKITSVEESAKSVETDGSKEHAEAFAQEPSSRELDESGNTTDQSSVIDETYDDDRKKQSAVSPEKSDEATVELKVDDIQSFEEWKQNQIQSQEEAAATETISSPHRTIRTKKTQMNYASQDCGAKILDHNPEAKHVSAILDENKDMYMLNPCSVDAWLVVELCEPIQVQQVQLSNLELFSSLPHLFDVSVSERFPAREWRSLGTFEAKNERIIQTFTSKREELMFAKYIKFEMKSHFGNEHFCPLSLIRILGVSMVEEYEEVEDKIATATTVVEQRKEANAEDANVNKEGNAEEATEAPTAASEGDTGSIGKVFNIVKSAVGNLLGNGKSKTVNVTVTEAASEGQNTTLEENIDSAWESPVTLVTNRSEVEQSSEIISKSPIITLLETGDGRDVLCLKRNEPPLYPIEFLADLSAEAFGTQFCWFLEFIYRVSILSCIVQPHGNETSSSGAFPRQIPAKHPDPISNDRVSFPKVAPPDNIVGDSDVPNFTLIDKSKRISDHLKVVPKVDMSLEHKEIPNSTKTGKPLNATILRDEAAANDTAVETLTNAVKTISNLQSKNPPVTVNDVLRAFRVDSKPTCDSKMADQQATQTSGDSAERQVEQDAIRLQNVQSSDSLNEQKAETEDSSEKKSPATLSSVDRSDATETQVTSADDGINEKANTKETPDLTNVKKPDPVQPEANGDVSASANVTSSATPSTDEASANKAENEDPVIINPGTNQKESVLMRLSNRIRTLEQNLSLSSAYLENLSQKYKRKMDEMQRLFNQTQARLTDMSRSAEENNIKLMEAIAREKEKTETLRKKLEETVESTEQLNHYMIARHLCLMALEGVLLIVICVTCFGVRQLRLFRKMEQTEKIVRELMHLQKGHFTNGSAKTATASGSNKDTRLEREEHAGRHGRHNTTKHRRRSSLPVDIDKSSVSNAMHSFESCSTPAAMQQNKTQKMLSTNFKKKPGNPGKLFKSTSKTSFGDLSSSFQKSSSWTTDLKYSKHPKSKKYRPKQENKHDSVSKTSTGFHFSDSNSSLSLSACRSNALSWHNKMFNAFSGKAR